MKGKVKKFVSKTDEYAKIANVPPRVENAMKKCFPVTKADMDEYHVLVKKRKEILTEEKTEWNQIAKAAGYDNMTKKQQTAYLKKNPKPISADQIKYLAFVWGESGKDPTKSGINYPVKDSIKMKYNYYVGYDSQHKMISATLNPHWIREIFNPVFLEII